MLATPPGSDADLTAVRRPDTVAQHQLAVERAIHTMTQDLASPHSTQSMAASVAMSPFYFIKVFKAVTGISPRLFLAAVRMERAKRALLASDASVTDICLDVGYSSLGTFSRIFHALVGLSPVTFREAVKQYAPEDLWRDALEFSRTHRYEGSDTLEGYVAAPENRFNRIIFVGAFRKAIPQGPPLAGTVLLGPGPFRIRRPAQAAFHLLVLQLPMNVPPFDPIRQPEQTRVARTLIAGDANHVRADLRPVAISDPPLVIALPHLLRTSI